MIPTFENSLAALGINSDGIGTTNLADLYRLDRPMSPQAKQLIQFGVNHVYDQFLAIVAEARNSTPERIHEIAQGRVWTGEKAKALGLVDHLGNLREAIDAAALAASLDTYQTEEVKSPMDFREQLMRQLSGSVVGQWVRWLPADWLPQGLLTGVYGATRELQLLNRFNDPRGLYLHCFECTAQ